MNIPAKSAARILKCWSSKTMSLYALPAGQKILPGRCRPLVFPSATNSNHLHRAQALPVQLAAPQTVRAVRRNPLGGINTVSGYPSQTRSYAPAAYIRSRSASELLLPQKTELPRLTTVCSGQLDTVSPDLFVKPA
jgi:hypothetical protein